MPVLEMVTPPDEKAQKAAQDAAALEGRFGRALAQFRLGENSDIWDLEGIIRVMIGLNEPIQVSDGENLYLVRFSEEGEALPVEANLMVRQNQLMRVTFETDTLGEYALLGVYDAEPETKTYTVTFMGPEGEEVETRILTAGAPLGELPEAPAREGYTFAGWIGEAGMAEESQTVTSDLVFQASYSQDYPAMVADAQTEQIQVHVVVPEGALPADTLFRMEAVNAEDYRRATEAAMGQKAGEIIAVDMTFTSPDGAEIQPLIPVTVEVTLPQAMEELDHTVVHIDDNNKGEVVARGLSGSAFSFEAASFSIYAVAGPVTVAPATGLDGKKYALVTVSNTLMLAQAHATIGGRLTGEAATIRNGLLRSGSRSAAWNFEAVSGQPGWYYISDGNGKYLNINGSEKSVTLGAKQAVYVTKKGSDRYQIRNSALSGAKAVNNYNNTTANGFGAWDAGNGDNEWFRLYETTYLGEVAVNFNVNGGAGAAPEAQYGIEGSPIVLPDYAGTKNGYTFIGWSTGSNLDNRDYYPLYPVGSYYTVPEKDRTLYAVWNSNTPATTGFFIRLDGRIPDEPGHYESSDYTGKIEITGTIRERHWITDNDQSNPNNGLYIENNVTAKLNQCPNVTQLVNNINNSYGKLGFKVREENGQIVVSEITNANTNAQKYNVLVGDGLYVLWYVQKRESDGWHVDGVLLVKDKVNIAYNANVDDKSVSNMPMGYQETKGTDVTIGASGRKNGTVMKPVRTGYNFLGWNLKPDGSGTMYQNGEIYTLNVNTTLYAQWSKGTNHMTVSKVNDDGEPLAGAKFTLEEKTDAGNWKEKVSKVTSDNGVFTYDKMENQTLYRLTETYAPSGYEVQNSFCFKVTTSEDNSTVLDLYVCDENGNRLNTAPDWLQVIYTAAQQDGGSGVATIKFVIRDERILRKITFVKTDENGDPLAGASYTLSGRNGNISGVLKEASDENGVFSVENATLPYGSYALSETKAPATYALSYPVTFTLNDYVNENQNGLTITSGNGTSACQVSQETVNGLTITTYAYTLTVSDTPQYYIRVKKNVEATGNLPLSNINMTVYYALTREDRNTYLKKEDGSLWLESIEIRNGVPTSDALFDGVPGTGKYDVWELALVDGGYTRVYNGLTFGDDYQVSHVSVSNDSGSGNNAYITESKRGAEVNFTNTYSQKTETRDFKVNKQWKDRSGNVIEPPAGASVEFTLYYENGDGTLTEVRSIELDGTADPDGEFAPWVATFKYLPIRDENGKEYVYKVRETRTIQNYYPNNYPQDYYVTTSGGTITNTLLLTDIAVHKHFDMQPNHYERIRNAAENLAFTLTNTTTGQSWEFRLSDFDNINTVQTDYQYTLRGMPLGSYTLTESGQETLFSSYGFDLVHCVATRSGEAGITFEASTPLLDTLRLENNYAQRGTLKVRKADVQVEQATTQEEQNRIRSKKFRFMVKYGDLYLQGDSSLGTTPFEFELANGQERDFSSAPSGSYTVYELDASETGYTWTVEGTVTEEEDGSRSKSATVYSSQTAQVEFRNRYRKIRTGNLRISKVVEGGPADAATAAYPVTVTTRVNNVQMYVTENGALSSEKTVLNVTPGTARLINNVPVGNYTLAEETEGIQQDGYNLTVTYSPNTVTVNDNATAECVVTNRYTLQETSVTVAKTVSGTGADLNLHFGFEMTVADAKGQAIKNIPGMDAKGVLTFSLKHGESRMVTGLPVGAVLTVKEHNENYTTTVACTTGAADSAQTVEGVTSTDPETNAFGYTFTVPEAGATVTFRNERKTAQVYLGKQVSGNMGEVTREFEFTVAASDTDGSPLNPNPTITDGNGKVLRQHGSAALLGTFPVGAIVTITETAVGEYTTNVALTGTAGEANAAPGAEAEVKSGNTITFTVGENGNTVTFYNHWEITIPTGVAVESEPYRLILGIALLGLLLLAGRKRRKG